MEKVEITQELKDKIIKHLYREYETDTTNVEINEILDELEGKTEEEYACIECGRPVEEPDASYCDKCFVELFEGGEK